jgi:hypothetical protein
LTSSCYSSTTSGPVQLVPYKPFQSQRTARPKPASWCWHLANLNNSSVPTCGRRSALILPASFCTHAHMYERVDIMTPQRRCRWVSSYAHAAYDIKHHAPAHTTSAVSALCRQRSVNAARTSHLSTTCCLCMRNTPRCGLSGRAGEREGAARVYIDEVRKMLESAAQSTPPPAVASASHGIRRRAHTHTSLQAALVVRASIQPLSSAHHVADALAACMPERHTHRTHAACVCDKIH